jgi:hypothetical protein
LTDNLFASAKNTLIECVFRFVHVKYFSIWMNIFPLSIPTKINARDFDTMAQQKRIKHANVLKLNISFPT